MGTGRDGTGQGAVLPGGSAAEVGGSLGAVPRGERANVGVPRPCVHTAGVVRRGPSPAEPRLPPAGPLPPGVAAPRGSRCRRLPPTIVRRRAPLGGSGRAASVPPPPSFPPSLLRFPSLLLGLRPPRRPDSRTGRRRQWRATGWSRSRSRR